MNEGATIRQRQLGHELRRLRGARSAAEVAAASGMSASKLSRMETAHVGVRENDVRALTRALQIGPEHTEKLVALAAAARSNSVMASYVGFEWASALRGHLELEADSQRITAWCLDLIPGLLQTTEYARALMEARPDVPNDQIARRLEFRALRQTRVREGALAYWAVLDEGTLRREIGGPTVMADQLESLLGRENVTLQVLPWAVGAHPGVGSAFQIFEFADWPALIYGETITQGVYRDDDDLVAVHRDFLEAIKATAASPKDSQRMIAEQVAALRARA